MKQILSITTALAIATVPVVAANPNWAIEDESLAAYFRSETEELADRCLAEARTIEEWKSLQETSRRQLFEMLGLDPLPDRTPLHATITGKVEHDSFIVEKLHFQSRPGLYVTANLYLPRQIEKPAPAILYVCGHGPVIKDGISYGNKVSYQHHGAWFARNGYVCLIIDTLQLGEIQGLHHGTYREGMWWWNSRGYTPAGVEAWNSIRALDYLETRPEVDKERFGVTGRSGGGAYSWWLTALDERIKAAAPVAGITDLHNHVVDGAVEGHCDCMFIVNTYRWDYPQVAALAAPRALLIANTDKDSIFPLDGVVRTYSKVKRIYDLYGANDKLGLLITEGPHKDTQDLQLPVFRWFNKHLKGEDPVIEMAALKLFEPEQLKVFNALPADQINTFVHSNFVSRASTPVPPRNAAEWEKLKEKWLAALREKTFRGWPENAAPAQAIPAFTASGHNLKLEAFDLPSQPHVMLKLYVLSRQNHQRPDRLILHPLDDAAWTNWTAAMRYAFPLQFSESKAPSENRSLAQDQLLGKTDSAALAELEKAMELQNAALAFLAPRGSGSHSWDANPRKEVQIRRRFMLLGQTRDAMRVWDTRRAIQALRNLPGTRSVPFWLKAEEDMAVNALYAALFEPGVAGLELDRLPVSHMAGADYLNVLRLLDLPQVIAMVGEQSMIRLLNTEAAAWQFPLDVARNLGWKKESVMVEARGAGASR